MIALRHFYLSRYSWHIHFIKIFKNVKWVKYVKHQKPDISPENYLPCVHAPFHYLTYADI